MCEKININGYNILYIKNNKNITEIQTFVNVGSIHEETEESGVAHLLEHILLDSWGACKNNCTEYWSYKGINSNGHTMSCVTTYFIFGSSENNEDLYEYMASIMTNPSFTEKTFEASKAAVLDELLIQLNDPLTETKNVLFRSFNDNVLNNFKYILDYKLKIDVLKKITLEQVIKFYNKWYTSNRINYTIVTNDNKSKVTKIMSKFLIKREIDNHDNIIHLSIGIPKSLVNRKTASKTTFMIAYIYNDPNPYEYLYAGLIYDMLVGDVSSIMYKELRDKLHLVYGVKLYFEFMKTCIMSVFEASCQVQNSSKLHHHFFETMKMFLTSKFSDNIFKRSKERILLFYENENKENTSYLGNFYTTQYLNTENINLSPLDTIKKINKISKKDLIAIANKMFKEYVIVCETR